MKDSIRLTSKKRSLLEANDDFRSKKRSKTVLDDLHDENEQKNGSVNSSELTNAGNPGVSESSTDNNGNLAETGKREDEKVDKTKLLSLFTDCMTALSSNKICSWNAFDIGIIDHIDDLVTLKNEQIEQEDIGDVCFSTASKVVEGASKVYGYRVEAVYDKTFNVLMNIQTTEKEQKKQRTGKKKVYEFTGGNTLSPESEVTLSELPVEAILMDPFFLKISSLFDQSGPQGLLLVNLLINSNLQLSLSSTAVRVDSEELGESRTVDVSQGLKENESALAVCKNKLNRSLLSQIALGFSDLEILPELNKYVNKLPKELLPGHLQSELTDLSLGFLTNMAPEKPAITDLRKGSIEAEPVVDIQLDESESIRQYGEEMEATQESIEGIQPTQESAALSELHDSYLDEGGYEGTQEEFYDANEVSEDLNLLDRINIIDIHNQLSFYSTSNLMPTPSRSVDIGEGGKMSGIKNFSIGGVGGTGVSLLKSNAHERGVKNRSIKTKPEKVTIEKYLYTSNLSEELDSIELLSHYTSSTNATNSGQSIKSGITSFLQNRKSINKATNKKGRKSKVVPGNWFEGNFVNMTYKINLNQLLNSYNIYLNMSNVETDPYNSTGTLDLSNTLLRGSMDHLSNQLNQLSSIRQSVLGSNRTSVAGDLGEMDPVGDALGDELIQQMEDQNNFIDVLKLKTYILEYLDKSSPLKRGVSGMDRSEDMDRGVERSGSKDSTSTSGSKEGKETDIKFNELVEYIYRKVNKKVVSIHILFVCLLHVCNESNLLLEPVEIETNFKPSEIKEDGGEMTITTISAMESSTKIRKNDFKIKFDHFNP